MLRILRRALIGVVIFFVTLILIGITYERMGEARDAKALPQVGRSYDVGGRSLNLYCSGEGSPAVIFEPNGGLPGFRWMLIQRQVAKFTRACWYDHAGLGWSDPGPFPNHSDSIAHDLHALLAAAKIPPPYVLVGHAMGAFHVRVFRSYFPEEVTGLVLVDPMNEDLTINIHNHNELLRPVAIQVIRGVTGVGLLRALQHDPGPPENGWSQHDWQTLQHLYRLRKARIAAAQELPIWVNGELARAGRCYGSLPLTVLSAGIQDQEEDPKLDHDHALKMRLHEQLAQLSTAGEQVIVPSGHDIPDQAPDAVIDAIHKTLLKAQTYRTH